MIGFLVDFHSMITWMVKVGGALLRNCFVIVDILFIYLYLFIYIYIFIFISCKYTSLHLPAPPKKNIVSHVVVPSVECTHQKQQLY